MKWALLKYLLLEVGQLYILIKANAIKFTPGKIHVLLSPIMRKIFQKVLFQFFVFYLSGRIWTI
jgi:hypothetical protein